MAKSYKALLHDDHVEWIDPPPPRQGATPVQITLLDQPASKAERGRDMAAALEKLAQRGGLRGIEDPVAWQREQRRDRPLPGRPD